MVGQGQRLRAEVEGRAIRALDKEWNSGLKVELRAELRAAVKGGVNGNR